MADATPAMEIDAPKGSTSRKPRRRPNNQRRQGKNESFLFKKNVQNEASRFRIEDAKLLSVPTELAVPVNRKSVAFSVCLYRPLLYCMQVLQMLRTACPQAPQISNECFLYSMRAVMTAKIAYGQIQGKIPANFSRHLMNAPVQQLRRIDTFLRILPSPIKRMIDCLGKFEINGIDYMPFVFRSSSVERNYLHVIDGLYTTKPSTMPISMAPPSTSAEASSSKRSRTDDTVVDGTYYPDRVLGFPWPNGEPEPMPASLLENSPHLNEYFEWSKAMQRFQAMEEVQICSGVGHPTQLIRSQPSDGRWHLWSYRDSGELDFGLGHYGFGEDAPVGTSTLPSVDSSLSVSEADIDAETRLIEELHNFKMSVSTI